LTSSGPTRALRRGRRTGRARLARAVLLLILVGVVFALGIGLGRALSDNGTPAGDVTRVRTLKPLPLAPARETVTVTEPSP
jgi:hypothetical protein